MRSGNLTFEVERYLIASTITFICTYTRERGNKFDLPHEFKLPVGRDETYCTRGIKFIKPHALMKPAVVQLYRVTLEHHVGWRVGLIGFDVGGGVGWFFRHSGSYVMDR